MADFPASAIDYIDTEVYEFGQGSIGAEMIEYLDPGAAAGSGSQPVVSLNFPLNQAVESQASIGLEVTDPDGNLGRVIITARIEAFGIEEVVFQGDRFAPAYAARSTRVAIANGFRYTISRSAGWPGSPSIDVYAVDAAGSEA